MTAEPLRRQVVNKYRNRGVSGMIGGGLRELGRKLEGTDERTLSRKERKREVIDGYREDLKYLNVGGGSLRP